MIKLKDVVQNKSLVRYDKLELIIRHTFSEDSWKLAKRNKLRGYDDYEVEYIQDFKEIRYTKIVLKEKKDGISQTNTTRVKEKNNNYVD